MVRTTGISWLWKSYFKDFSSKISSVGDCSGHQVEHDLAWALDAKKPNGLLAFTRLLARQNRLPIHSTDEDAPGILQPVLGSPVQEKHGAAGKSNKGPQRWG